MKTKKASALVFSLIILSMMLATAISVASVAVKDRKSSLATDKSNQAFQVADSGVEVMLKKIYKGNYSSGATLSQLTGCNDSSGTAIVSGDLGGGKTYEISFYDSAGALMDECNVDEIEDINQIKSVGSYASTLRAVQMAVAQRDKLEEDADVMILMDCSGSMSLTDLDNEKNAVKNLIDNLGGQYRFGIIFFSDTLSVQTLTDDKAQLDIFIDAHNSVANGTNTGGAISRAATELQSGLNNRHGTNPQAIILITDGAPNLSSGTYDSSVVCVSSAAPPGGYWNITGAQAALAASTTAKSEEITIFTVGVGLDNLDSQECRTRADNLMTNMATSSLDYYSINDFGSLGSVLDNLQ